MKWIARISLVILLTLTLPVFALPDNPLGQVITIETHLHSFIGKPIWTLVIRDIDHNQNIPYIFDVRKGWNHWVVFTYGRNYKITASNLQIETYQMSHNKYKNFRIKNFCNIESNGRIMRGESMRIIIDGHLSPKPWGYSCNILTFPEENYYIYKN